MIERCKAVVVLLGICTVLLVTGRAEGEVINYTTLASYNAAVGPHPVITFQEFPPGTALTTQYLPQGLTFLDGNDTIVSNTAFITDGVGLRGSASDATP